MTKTLFVASFLVLIPMTFESIQPVSQNVNQKPTLMQPRFSEQKTVLDRIGERHLVTEGFVCRSPRDIRCIDGVCNTPTHFWSITVNGNYRDFNSQSYVLPTDRVRVEFLAAEAFVEEK